MSASPDFSLRKMHVAQGEHVAYTLLANDASIDMNALIGRELTLAFAGRIECVACGRVTAKSFNQGHCYDCFRTLAACDRCIMSPELCHYAQGTCREPAWGEANCMRPHFVYLANSSGLKVGITRETQMPTRWIDQGARQALPIFKVASRHVSGLVETVMKQHVSDRTDWRAMLRGDPPPLSLTDERDRLLAQSRAELGLIPDVEPLPQATVHEFNYPVEDYPQKVRSLTAEKHPLVRGRLLGIKGQYLILDCGVFNVRRHGGYRYTLDAI